MRSSWHGSWTIRLRGIASSTNRGPNLQQLRAYAFATIAIMMIAISDHNKRTTTTIAKTITIATAIAWARATARATATEAARAIPQAIPMPIPVTMRYQCRVQSNTTANQYQIRIANNRILRTTVNSNSNNTNKNDNNSTVVIRVMVMIPAIMATAIIRSSPTRIHIITIAILPKRIQQAS